MNSESEANAVLILRVAPILTDDQMSICFTLEQPFQVHVND